MSGYPRWIKRCPSEDTRGLYAFPTLLQELQAVPLHADNLTADITSAARTQGNDSRVDGGAVPADGRTARNRR